MIWYIAAGSDVGGVGRYLIGNLIQRWLVPTCPVGTLLVNVGPCGGYTTFSTAIFLGFANR